MPNAFLTCLAAGIILVSCASHVAAEFDPGLAGFTVQFRTKTVPYREFSFSVMPAEQVPITIPDANGSRFRLSADGGKIESAGDAHWRWIAPGNPGHHALRVERADGASIALRVFVLRPATEIRGEELNGYRIGVYPSRPLRQNPVYLPPAGFIEVTADMLDLPVTPHFTLGQFLCKQQPGHWPKYLLLREPLLVKLELLLAEVNRLDYRTDSFHVMSGFRTPWYNEQIGNGRYSRHVWGGAADIFIDTSGDGRMDDLNGDGRVDYKDAEILHAIIEDMSQNGMMHRYLGGLGLYGPRPHRGPFVHIDARGEPARWSTL